MAIEITITSQDVGIVPIKLSVVGCFEEEEGRLSLYIL